MAKDLNQYRPPDALSVRNPNSSDTAASRWKRRQGCGVYPSGVGRATRSSVCGPLALGKYHGLRVVYWGHNRDVGKATSENPVLRLTIECRHDMTTIPTGTGRDSLGLPQNTAPTRKRACRPKEGGSGLQDEDRPGGRGLPVSFDAGLIFWEVFVHGGTRRSQELGVRMEQAPGT